MPLSTKILSPLRGIHGDYYKTFKYIYYYTIQRKLNPMTLITRNLNQDFYIAKVSKFSIYKELD